MEENPENENTPTEFLDTIKYPINKTIIDRYVFAANFVKNKTVFDIPCGYGHGTKMFWALGAKNAIGFDRSLEALDYARQNVEDDSSKVMFMYSDMCVPIVMQQDQQADVVVSLEGVEHVSREDFSKALTNFKGMCKPGGTIIISTPRRKTPEWVYRGGQHMYEYDLNEFQQELRSVFNGDITFYFACEFNLPRIGKEECTIFSTDSQYADKCAVMVAVITND